jgi:DNA modification methylase
MIEIRCGKMELLLPELEAESFHACVCDPPYGLEFMGKEWDSFRAPTGGARFTKDGMGKGFKALPSFTGSPNPSCRNCGGTLRGNDRKGFSRCRCERPDFPNVRLNQMVAFQDWCEIWAREVYRVLKPGAHLLAFGGTRTYHRLACAIEDAGFEIRDTIMWLYGCLSEDTEILVDGQWEPYHSAIAGRRALCYDAQHDEYSWQPIQDLYVYGYDDTAFRIRSDRTDQIVSRNHRCLVERSGALVFELAEEAARQREARVPVLEDLPALLSNLPVPDERAGNEEQDLWSSVRPSLALETTAALPQANHRSQGQEDRLRGMREGAMAARCLAETDLNAGLLAAMQWDASRRGVGQARTQGARCMVAGSGKAMAAKDDWIWESSLEGRRDVFPQARQLQADQVRALPARVPTDGAEGWLCDGASADRGTSNWTVPSQDRGCPSRGPRPTVEWATQPHALCEQSGSQALRASRFTRTDLARIEPVHYHGLVWCVRVPTGAFVARRNGKVFVTGNSGFPKSHDVSKAIDRAAGVEREVLGIRKTQPKFLHAGNGQVQEKWRDHDTVEITAPATEAAREWQGWGTALKPACEPIVVARKPLAEGTVAAQVLATGTGALNIDASRVPTDAVLTGGGGKLWSHYRDGTEDMAVPRVNDGNGRWPANCAHDGSPEVLAAFARFGERTSGSAEIGPTGGDENERFWKGKKTSITSCFADTGTAARFFFCAKADASERIGNHPTVKPVALMEWLVGLVTPPGGRILDPFCGTGSTLVAADRLGFDALGIEQDAQTVADAHEKMKRMRARRMIGAAEAPVSDERQGQLL